MKSEEVEAFQNWLENQPYWLQDFTYKFYSGIEVDSKIIAEYAALCLNQIEKRDCKYNKLNKMHSLDKVSYQRVVLKSISSIQGVNALSSKTKLDFHNEGLTVIYGENGAGKTGYIRVIEAICGSPYKAKLLPDVYDNKHIEQICKCEIECDGQLKEREINLSKDVSVAELAETDIFDSLISNLYIKKESTASYQPYVFRLLSRAATVAEQVDEYLENQIRIKKQLKLDIPDTLKNIDEASWLAHLNADTVIPDEYRAWNKQQEAELQNVQKVLQDSNPQEAINRNKTISVQLGEAIKILHGIEDRFTEQYLGEVQTYYEVWLQAKNVRLAAEQLFSSSAEDTDKISMTISAWRSMWKSAREYYEVIQSNSEIENSFGDECPLCHQKIVGKTQKRFVAVDKYVNGSALHDEEEAYKTLKSACRQMVGDDNYSEIQGYILGFIDEDLIGQVKTFYLKLAQLQNINDIDNEYINDLNQIDLTKIISQLTEIKENADKKVENLIQITNADKRMKMQNRANHLEFVKWISEHIDTVTSVIENEKEVSELQEAQKLVKTRAITMEVNSLSDSILTKAYISRFEENIKFLAPQLHVKIEKEKSKKGKTPYKLVLLTDDENRNKPELILSEGEQRIAALAEFFADATGRTCESPVIIDDPISSLDVNYESRATRKIVELAKKRQVIVFTHRISLIVGLHEECQKIGVNFSEQHIVGRDNCKGIHSDDVIYTGKISQELSDLLQLISRAKKYEENPEIPESIVQAQKSRICQQFRICVERSVEDTLFGGMVHRFDKVIHTEKKVKKIANIQIEDCEIIDEFMTKYSYTEHSQSDEGAVYSYSYDEIKADVERLQKWTKNYKKRMGW